MWWRVNLQKFARQLVPPVLRSKFLTGLIDAVLTPLRELLQRFTADRNERLENILTTPQTGVLEAGLNRRFGYPEVDPPIIRVETVASPYVRMMYTRAEGLPIIMRMASEDVALAYWLCADDVISEYNIRVAVPKLLQSEEAAISDYLNRHVAAGRTWHFEWYDF